MSINGVLQNVKWPELFLTETNDKKVVGENLTKCENQRWIGEYVYDAGMYLGTIMNKDSGDYLSWDEHMNVVMNGSNCWWKLVFMDGCIGFQVPKEASANAIGVFFTLELEDDRSVTLKVQEGDLIQAQLWKAMPF
ncbi:hypothetical protein CY34DRAFT_799874, partial [Suillus luteus UH-Slu-Lm8-n1]